MAASSEAIQGQLRTYQGLLYSAWDGFNSRSAMFDPNYTPSTTAVMRLQATKLGNTNPEQVSLSALR